MVCLLAATRTATTYRCGTIILGGSCVCTTPPTRRWKWARPVWFLVRGPHRPSSRIHKTHTMHGANGSTLNDQVRTTTKSIDCNGALYIPTARCRKQISMASRTPGRPRSPRPDAFSRDRTRRRARKPTTQCLTIRVCLLLSDQPFTHALNTQFVRGHCHRELLEKAGRFFKSTSSNGQPSGHMACTCPAGSFALIHFDIL